MIETKFMIDDGEFGIINSLRRENLEILSKNNFLEKEVATLKVNFFLSKEINHNLENEIKKIESENRKLKKKKENSIASTNLSREEEKSKAGNISINEFIYIIIFIIY